MMKAETTKLITPPDTRIIFANGLFLILDLMHKSSLSLGMIVSRTMVTDNTVRGQLALEVEGHVTTIPIHYCPSISRNDSLSDHGDG